MRAHTALCQDGVDAAQLHVDLQANRADILVALSEGELGRSVTIGPLDSSASSSSRSLGRGVDGAGGCLVADGCGTGVGSQGDDQAQDRRDAVPGFEVLRPIRAFLTPYYTK